MRRSTYQGPTSIVNMVSNLLEDSDIVSTSLMAHLPQFVQLEEDHMGKSRLMEALCSMYDFPESLIRPERGRKQYEEISSAIQNNNEVRRLIRQFEQYYDRIQSSHSPLRARRGHHPRAQRRGLSSRARRTPRQR